MMAKTPEVGHKCLAVNWNNPAVHLCIYDEGGAICAYGEKCTETREEGYEPHNGQGT